MSTMNQRIKDRRKELGLTQKELADILSISDKTVSRWESNNQMPDAIILPDLADALKISINDLYGLTADKSQEENSSIKPQFPQVKPIIVIIYRIAVIISLVLFVFGAMLLIQINSIRLVQGSEKDFGNVFLFAGGGILLTCEIAYTILYRNKAFYNPLYLKEDILFSGLGAICISAVSMIILPLFLAVQMSYWYELYAVLLLIAFEVMILFQKRKLREEGIHLSKKISIISIIIISVCVVVLLGVFIFFRCFYHYHILKTSDDIMRLLLELSGETPFESKARLYSFILLSFPMVTALLINYIQLLNKSKQLK